jgi:tetratricopeptide (TPR) repeat protein
LKFSQHQHDQAIEHLEAFAAEKTAFAPALAVWGDILSSRKQFDEARKKYHSAITADPRAANGYVGMAILNRRRGRFRRALGWSRKALKIDPYFVAALSSEAESLRALGKLDEATEAYARVLELDPYQASAHVGLGHLERLRHRLHEAVSQFERATIIDGTEGWAWRSWGDVLVEMHHYEDAIEKYQSALELDPGDGAALASLGSVWVTLGRIKEGLEILRSACVVDGLNDVTWSREVTALVSLDLTEEALRQIQNANALFPSDPRLHVDWGRVLHDMGRSAQAIAKFEEAVEIDPYFAIAHNWLAIEQGRLKHRVEARQSFRNALALQPRNDWIRRSIGQWLRNDKKFKLAMRWYRWSYRQVPESAKLLMEWSITSRMIAESPETGEGQRAALMHSAEELIDQAIRLDIWDTSLVIAKSDLLVASDRHTEAVKGLERAHALDPYDPVVLIRYGEILIKLKRPSEAAKAYHGALQLRPNNEKWRKKLESLS